MTALTDRERFFYDHAGFSYARRFRARNRRGFSYDPATETPDQGRERCARELAAAEAEAKARGWTITWEHDPDVMDDDVDSVGMVERGEAVNLYVGLLDAHGVPLDGIGGVTVEHESDPYVTVVGTDLALDLLDLEREDAVAGDLI